MTAQAGRRAVLAVSSGEQEQSVPQPDTSAMREYWSEGARQNAAWPPREGLARVDLELLATKNEKSLYTWTWTQPRKV